MDNYHSKGLKTCKLSTNICPFLAIIKFQTMVKRDFGRKLKRIRFENRGEYIPQGSLKLLP